MKRREKYKGYTWMGKLAPYKNGVLAVFVLGFGALGGYILLFGSSAAPPPPTVYVNPATQTLAPGTDFTVQVRENSGTTAVNAVQANLSYPAGLMDFVSVSTAGTAFTTDAPSSGGAGQVSIARGLIGSVTGDQLVATITFHTLTTSGAAPVAFTSGTVLLSSTTNTDILGSLSATGGGTYTIDNTPPTVSVTTPAEGATLSGGSTIAVTVSATDAASAIASVDMYIDGSKVTTLTTSPYTYSWNTNGVTLGSHTLQAKAFDAIGNLGSSPIVNVTVADTTAPSTSITSPASNATVAGAVTVNATALDNVGGTGVAKVEFYVDGVLKTTDTISPYSFSWDSRTATDGTRSLTVKAYDNATPANVATSTAVPVKVDNTAPTAPGNLRSTAATLSGITLAWNASTDTNGVTTYRVQRNGVTIATLGAVLTYADSGLSSGTSYTYTVAALDAMGNTSTGSTLAVSTAASKIGDLNADNLINITDLSILLSHWNTSDAASDINHDGAVNIFDLSAMLSHWGT